MPEADPEIMQCFVSWTYTGRYNISDNDLTREEEQGLEDNTVEDWLSTEEYNIEAWIAADMLIAPKFANDIMYRMTQYFKNATLEAKAVRHVHDHCLRESPLWRFVLALVAARGPFAEEGGHDEATVAGWEEMLKTGGDFVPNLLRQVSFRENQDSNDSECPCHVNNYQKFMMEEKGPTALEWLQRYE